MAVYSEDTGVFFVAKQVRYREDRAAPNALLISNMDLPEVDHRFTDENFRDAVGSYFELLAMRVLDIDPDLQRYKPDNKIEVDRVDETGKKYRIAPDIDNGQVAIMAIAACAVKQRAFSAAIEVYDGLAELYGDEPSIITI
jgi:hypothetical protein